MNLSNCFWAVSGSAPIGPDALIPVLKSLIQRIRSSTSPTKALTWNHHFNNYMYAVLNATEMSEKIAIISKYVNSGTTNSENPNLI